MKGLVQSLYANPNYAKVLEWGKLLTITGSAQVAVQAISLVCGIMVIRLLPTHEYALYTLANTMLGTMIALADGGISTGVITQGGRVWQDRAKLGAVLATGMELRRRFALGSLLVATPILLYLLLRHDADWPTALLIFATLIPAFLTTLSGTLLQTAPKLWQDLVPLQKNQVGVNAARLVLLLTLFAFPWTFVALLAAGLPQIYANRHLLKISDRYADSTQAPDPVVRRDILAIVRRTLPDAIYYCLSGQITIWLISVFGSTRSVAEVGALGRLAIIMTLLSTLFATLVLPRFARLPTVSRLLISRFVQIELGLLILCACLVGLVWFFSAEILWILGPNYSKLNNELVLTMIGSCLSFIAGTLFFLCTSRGWVINPAVSIPISLASIVCAALLIDVSTLPGILKLNIAIAIVQVIMHATYGLIRLGNANAD